MGDGARGAFNLPATTATTEGDLARAEQAATKVEEVEAASGDRFREAQDAGFATTSGK